MAVDSSARLRDAARSRKAILDAAERLFAERGYDGASLAGIAAEAGLSRGTPSYFFGSKERLYIEVLDRVFAARQAATDATFAPVRAWCAGGEGPAALRAALIHAAEGYLGFLVRRPSFVRLVAQEELGGGGRMPSRNEASTAMQDAFSALQQVGAARGIRAFEVTDAILVFVGLTFTPASLQNTLMRVVGRDLKRSAARRRQATLAVDQLMHLLTG
jgi:TetR/AcrR family transcriptional regulator